MELVQPRRLNFTSDRHPEGGRREAVDDCPGPMPERSTFHAAGIIVEA